MPKLIVRFYEELNYFLPREHRKTDFEVEFKDKRSIKDLIEALGVPHPEVDLILVNGTSVNFNYILRNGDRISVYPVFETINIKNITHLRKIPLRKTEFIADINLGRLVRYMRALGFDVYFDPTLSAKQVMEISKKENRIILTTSRKLLKFKEVTHGIFIYKDTIAKQIKKILEFLDLKERVNLFSRCLSCNSLLIPIEKQKIEDRLPPKVREIYNEYTYCKPCDKIYWHGTHCLQLGNVFEDILSVS